MIKQSLTTSKGILLWLFLPISMLFMFSCSSDKDEQDPTPGGGSLQMKIKSSSPQMPCELLVTSQEGSEVSTQFTSSWNSNSTIDIWAKQSGKLVYLGEQDLIVESSDKKNGIVEFDATGKLDAGKPYEVYGLGCSWKRDGDDLYYRTNLHRGGNFGIYFKVPGRQSYIETKESIAGTTELLFIINKSGNPIKFRHKGFDAEKKWYYTHAEVNIDNGKVVNTEQKDEAVSDVVDIAAFTGKNAYRIYSYYVPNGNKIQDAQLIAEIDGKEVRSENRISSDITLQTNHAYGMFAVWDGEKLTLGDEEKEPVVHVYSNDDTYDTTVENILDDGTVVLSSDETDIPQTGEIIYSDVTTVAPYGFLYKVRSVEKKDGKTYIHTSPATLGELLPNQKFKAPIQLYEGKPAAGARRPARVRGNVIDADEEPINLFSKTFTKDFKTGDTKWGDIEFTIGAKFLGDFDLETHYTTVERLAIEAGISVYLKLVLELALEKKWEIPFGELDDLPMLYVPTPVGISIPIKMVAAMKFGIDPKDLYKSPFAGQVNPSAKAYIKWTPLDKDFYFKGKMGYTRIPDEDGKNIYAKFESNIPTTKDEFVEMLKEMLYQATDVELGVKGDIKLKAIAELRFKPFDLDLASVAVQLTPYIGVNGEISWAYKYSTGSFWDDVEFKDDISLYVGADVSADATLNLSDDNIKKFTTGDANIIERDLVSGGFFFPQYYNMQITPTENVLKAGYVNFSVMRSEAFLFRAFFPEEDYGFCLSRTDAKPREWQYISLKSIYGDRGSTPFVMSAELSTAGLEPGKSYEVRPYSKVRTFGYIKREGGKFNMGSRKSDGTGEEIPDVPGENF